VASVGRRAGVVAAAVVLTLLSAGCPAAPATSAPGGHACGAGTNAATARSVDVYVALLRHLVAQAEPGSRPGQVLYVADHAVPYDDNAGAAVPAERRTPTAPRSTSTAPFAAAVRQCLGSVWFPDLPPIRLVRGFDDPKVAKSGSGPYPTVANGRVVELEGVPSKGNRLELAASSNGGGGNNAFGGIYILERRQGTWQVVARDLPWVA
jgi:hypothetical protein